MWSSGSLENLINDSKREKTEAWASWCGVHQYPITPLSPLDEQKSERPRPISPTAHQPCPYLIHALLILELPQIWMCFLLCPFISDSHGLCTSASVSFHCQFCPTSVSCPVYLSRSPCLPHSGFLSARNRSANHTTPGELSWSTMIKNVLMGRWKDLASLVSTGNLGFQFVLLQLSSHLPISSSCHYFALPSSRQPFHHTLRKVEGIRWFLRSPEGTTV